MIMRILQASPVIIYTGALSTYILTGWKLPLVFIVGAMIFSSFTNPLLKKFFESTFGDLECFKRPNPPAEGCGIFPDVDMPGSKTFGMPSGHVQLLTFTATFWSLYLIQSTIGSSTSGSSNGESNELLLRLAFLWLSAIAVAYHRIESGCHNLIQCVVGGLFGIFFGVLFYFLITKIEMLNSFDL